MHEPVELDLRHRARPDMKMNSRVRLLCQEAIKSDGYITVPNGIFAGQLQRMYPKLQIRIRD